MVRKIQLKEYSEECKECSEKYKRVSRAFNRLILHSSWVGHSTGAYPDFCCICDKGSNPSQGYPHKLRSGLYDSLPIIISLYPQEETSMGRVQCAQYPISSYIITLKSKSNQIKNTQFFQPLPLKNLQRTVWSICTLMLLCKALR